MLGDGDIYAQNCKSQAGFSEGTASAKALGRLSLLSCLKPPRRSEVAGVQSVRGMVEGEGRGQGNQVIWSLVNY